MSFKKFCVILLLLLPAKAQVVAEVQVVGDLLVSRTNIRSIPIRSISTPEGVFGSESSTTGVCIWRIRIQAQATKENLVCSDKFGEERILSFRYGGPGSTIIISTMDPKRGSEKMTDPASVWKRDLSGTITPLFRIGDGLIFGSSTATVIATTIAVPFRDGFAAAMEISVLGQTQKGVYLVRGGTIELLYPIPLETKVFYGGGIAVDEKGANLFLDNRTGGSSGSDAFPLTRFESGGKRTLLEIGGTVDGEEITSLPLFPTLAGFEDKLLVPYGTQAGGRIAHVEGGKITVIRSPENLLIASGGSPFSTGISSTQNRVHFMAKDEVRSLNEGSLGHGGGVARAVSTGDGAMVFLLNGEVWRVQIPVITSSPGEVLLGGWAKVCGKNFFFDNLLTKVVDENGVGLPVDFTNVEAGCLTFRAVLTAGEHKVRVVVGSVNSPPVPLRVMEQNDPPATQVIRSNNSAGGTAMPIRRR